MLNFRFIVEKFYLLVGYVCAHDMELRTIIILQYLSNLAIIKLEFLKSIIADEEKNITDGV